MTIKSDGIGTYYKTLNDKRRNILLEIDHMWYFIKTNMNPQDPKDRGFDKYSQINFASIDRIQDDLEDLMETDVRYPTNQLILTSKSEILKTMKNIIPPISETTDESDFELDFFYEGEYIGRMSYRNPEEYFKNFRNKYKYKEDLSDEENFKIISEVSGEKLMNIIKSSLA